MTPLSALMVRTHLRTSSRPWIRSGPDPRLPLSASVSRLESRRDSYREETAVTDVRCTVHLLGLNAAQLPGAGGGEVVR